MKLIQIKEEFERNGKLSWESTKEAIQLLQEQQDELECLKRGLREIVYPDVAAFLMWKEQQGRMGNEVNESDWFSALAKEILFDK